MIARDRGARRSARFWHRIGMVAAVVVSGLLPAAPSPASAAQPGEAADGGRIIQTMAGTGTSGFGGDGGPATAAALSFPGGLASDAAGSVYIADVFNNRVRKIDRTGNISTVAGNGGLESSGDDGPALLAGLSPADVAVDADGNLFIADAVNSQIRKVDTSGIITRFAGTSRGYGGDGEGADASQLAGPRSVSAM